MLVVETIAKIRLAYFFAKDDDQGDSPRMRVFREKWSKVIRSQATEFHYQRDANPSRKIGALRAVIYIALENDGKSRRASG